jgi:hypothetical protein
MNIQIALEELDISLDEVELTKLDQEFIRKKYHKMALKWHPDKNKDENSSNKFKKINESYEYLINEINIINGSNTSDPFVSSFDYKESKIYGNILSTFISSIFPIGSNNDNFYTEIINIIKDIVLSYDEITLSYLRKIFDQLDKQKAIDVYNLLYKYKDILYIKSEILEFVSLIVKEKFKNDIVFILKPLLKDLLDNNIYKLFVDEKLYLVPLWHNELYFDVINDEDKDKEIIVLCQPVLPDELTIDENNNIYITKEIHFADLKQMIFINNFVSLEIGEKCFLIPLDKLQMKKEQIYRLKGQGISQILEKDIYNVSYKSDIIVNIKII